jgi:hypothetical protein
MEAIVNPAYENHLYSFSASIVPINDRKRLTKTMRLGTILSLG